MGVVKGGIVTEQHTTSYGNAQHILAPSWRTGLLLTKTSPMVIHHCIRLDALGKQSQHFPSGCANPHSIVTLAPVG